MCIIDIYWERRELNLAKISELYEHGESSYINICFKN